MSTKELNWRLRGNCIDVDPDVMHPDKNATDEYLAKRVCNGCPVSAECFLDSIRLKDWEGVRAEMTGQERKNWWLLNRAQVVA